MSEKKLSYKERFDEATRKDQSIKIRTKYPDRVPIIVEVIKDSNLNLDKEKYLVPNDLTIGQFIFVIRKRMKINPTKAIFLFVNNNMPPSNALISIVYDEHKDNDGFLYIKVTSENTFG
jgi:GABA(A) receptor-associated protein